MEAVRWAFGTAFIPAVCLWGLAYFSNRYTALSGWLIWLPFVVLPVLSFIVSYYNYRHGYPLGAQVSRSPSFNVKSAIAAVAVGLFFAGLSFVHKDSFQSVTDFGLSYFSLVVGGSYLQRAANHPATR